MKKSEWVKWRCSSKGSAGSAQPRKRTSISASSPPTAPNIQALRPSLPLMADWAAAAPISDCVMGSMSRPRCSSEIDVVLKPTDEFAPRRHPESRARWFPAIPRRSGAGTLPPYVQSRGYHRHRSDHRVRRGHRAPLGCDDRGSIGNCVQSAVPRGGAPVPLLGRAAARRVRRPEGRPQELPQGDQGDVPRRRAGRRCRRRRGRGRRTRDQGNRRGRRADDPAATASAARSAPV